MQCARALVSCALLTLLCAASCAVAHAGYPVQAPLPVTADAVRFAVMGDFGAAGPAEARVAQLVRAWQPLFVVTVGDNNYPDGAAATLDANVGQYYHDFIAFDPNYSGAYKGQGAAQQRFFASLGNHDWRTAGAQPYLDYFALPGNERYYRVRQGPVELFIVDSDEQEPDGNTAASVQARWLQAALQDSTAAWKLVFLHHAPFSSGYHGCSEALQWPYKAWGAHAVVAGHDHHYERIEADGLPYWVVGTGGASLRTWRRWWGPPNMRTDIFFAQKHGALLITADAHSAEFSFYTVDQERVDSHRLQHGG